MKQLFLSVFILLASANIGWTQTPAWVNVKDAGAVGDGASDDTAAINAAIAAAATGFGGYKPIYLPAGVYKITGQITLPDNITFFGDGSRPGKQGGSEIRYFGSASVTAVVAGHDGADWSNCQLKALRITNDSSSGITSGYGLEVINPTNSSTVSDVSVFGFPDGQILISNATGGSNPGANFFRLSSFFVAGGKNPLYIRGGRQQVYIDFGGVDLGTTSRQGVLFESGEAQANVITVTAVKVEGNQDVPGFKVAGIAPVTFIGCTRYNYAMNGTQPAFLFTYPPQPDLQVQLIGVTALGTSTLFHAPERAVTIPGSQSLGRYLPFLLVGGRGAVFAPYNTSADFNRTIALQKDVKMGWTGDTGSSERTDTNLYRQGVSSLETNSSFSSK